MSKSEVGLILTGAEGVFSSLVTGEVAPKFAILPLLFLLVFALILLAQAFNHLKRPAWLTFPMVMLFVAGAAADCAPQGVVSGVIFTASFMAIGAGLGIYAERLRDYVVSMRQV